tara:strand:- start:139 stop:897 length:759 start_codon:yes stop_codon:yes gene_type:complete
MGRLDDRVIIITGGAAGIGKAFADGYVREGASVVLADVNGEAAEASAIEINESGGSALALQVDVSDQMQTEFMTAETIKRFGKIDGLVNNAAIAIRVHHTRAPLEEIPVDEFDRMLAVNLKGVFLSCRAVLPHMKERKYGKIINMSSGTYFNGRANLVHYVASKGGVIALTRVLSREVGDWNITVNSIAPGLTASETEEHDIQQFAARIPDRSIKRIEVPEDLVGAGIFFISKESDFITGQTLIVDGGVVLN